MGNSDFSDILSVADELTDSVSKVENFSPSDIVILIDSKAVGGLGHVAVLIGSEKDGWYYYSLNGTGGDKGRAYGDALGADVGVKLGKVSMADAIKLVNTVNPLYQNNYDNNLALLSSPAEDKAMMKSAANAAGVKKYILTSQDCLTVPMSAFNQLKHMRLGGGTQTAKVPNAWRSSLPFYIGLMNLLYLSSDSELKYK